MMNMPPSMGGGAPPMGPGAAPPAAPPAAPAGPDPMMLAALMAAKKGKGRAKSTSPKKGRKGRAGKKR